VSSQDIQESANAKKQRKAKLLQQIISIVNRVDQSELSKAENGFEFEQTPF